MSPLMRAWCFHGADELVETEIGGAATEAAMTELLTADLSGLETAVLMIDGLNVGLRLGDTENSVVVKDLLSDLVDRGLRYEHGIRARRLQGVTQRRDEGVRNEGSRAEMHVAQASRT